jgi:outer membrane murein-binding lipoprotein Lpp
MTKLIPILLGSTALIATPALAEAPQVQPVDNSGVVTISRAQLDQILSNMQSMQAEIDQLKSGQTATAQTAAAAQTAAEAAQAAAAKPAPAPKIDIPAWIKNTSISGKSFANVSSITHKSDGVDLADGGTQTELKRFYIGVDHKFNDVFSANITTDFRYGANGTSKDVLVYVKKAYLQAKLAPEFFVRIGSADLPWVPFDESIYGYRFVENTLIDRTKFGTSADWGVHVGGSLLGGKVSYAASAINGAGYKTLSRSSDTIDLEGRISANPIKNVTLAVGGYTGKLGKSADNLPDSATPHRATRWNALAAYTDSRIRAGVEYFQAKNWNNVNTLATDKSNGWSAFGSFAFTPKIAVFGRYDWVKPNRITNPALKDHYFNVGLDYKPIKEIDLALVYKRDSARNGFLSTSNGTIGGLDKGTYDEFGLFTQLAF